MKANIKPELARTAPASKKELNRWGPLTPGQWVAVAFVFFAAAMFYGDKSSPMHQQGNEVVPPPSEVVGELLGQVKSGDVEPDKNGASGAVSESGVVGQG